MKSYFFRSNDKFTRKFLITRYFTNKKAGVSSRLLLVKTALLHVLLYLHPYAVQPAALAVQALS